MHTGQRAVWQQLTLWWQVYPNSGTSAAGSEHPVMGCDRGYLRTCNQSHVYGRCMLKRTCCLFVSATVCFYCSDVHVLRWIWHHRSPDLTSSISMRVSALTAASSTGPGEMSSVGFSWREIVIINRCQRKNCSMRFTRDGGEEASLHIDVGDACDCPPSWMLFVTVVTPYSLAPSPQPKEQGQTGSNTVSQSELLVEKLQKWNVIHEARPHNVTSLMLSLSFSFAKAELLLSLSGIQPLSFR